MVQLPWGDQSLVEWVAILIMVDDDRANCSDQSTEADVGPTS